MPVYASSGQKKTKYLFVDGGYLDGVIRRWSDKVFPETMELKCEDLFADYDKIFYYHCLPPRKNGESESEFQQRTESRQIFFDELSLKTGFHVHLGTIKSRANKAEKAQQKQVDVLIAVHMLCHTIRGNMDSATLLAGDLDFKPLVDALVQEGMNVVVWCEETSVSKSLLQSADIRQPLTLWGAWTKCSSRFKEKYPIGYTLHSKLPGKEYRHVTGGASSRGNLPWDIYEATTDACLRWSYYRNAPGYGNLRMSAADGHILASYLELEGEDISAEAHDALTGTNDS